MVKSNHRERERKEQSHRVTLIAVRSWLNNLQVYRRLPQHKVKMFEEKVATVLFRSKQPTGQKKTGVLVNQGDILDYTTGMLD